MGQDTARQGGIIFIDSWSGRARPGGAGRGTAGHGSIWQGRDDVIRVQLEERMLDAPIMRVL